MSSYFVKYASTFTSDHSGKELLTKIYECIDEENLKIQKQNATIIFPETIRFVPIPIDLNDDVIIEKINKMEIIDLHQDFVKEMYLDESCVSLIRMDGEDIHTILSFSFNTEESCIEIESFCRNQLMEHRGSGSLLNYLINSIKCAIYLIEQQEGKLPEKYHRIMLKSVKKSVDYYSEKFKFEITKPATTLRLPILSRTISHTSPPQESAHARAEESAPVTKSEVKKKRRRRFVIDDGSSKSIPITLESIPTTISDDEFYEFIMHLPNISEELENYGDLAEEAMQRKRSKGGNKKSRRKSRKSKKKTKRNYTEKK
jgi:hypothetical protein